MSRSPATPGAALKPPPRWLWGALFAAALVLRLAYFFEVRGDILFGSLLFDSQYYDAWARSLLSKGWLGNGIYFVSPLYAYFLAVVYALGGSITAARLIQFLIGSCVPLFVYSMGCMLMSRRRALLASLISVFYGPAIFFESLLLKSVLEVFWCTAGLWCVMRAQRSLKPAAWFAAGMCLGFAALAKDTVLVFALALAVFIAVTGRLSAPAVKRVFSFLLGFGLVIGVLAVRNLVVGKDAVLTTYGAGINFYIGNFRGADGGLKEPDFMRIDPAFEEIDSLREARRRSGRPLKPSQVSRFWTRQTIEEIRSDPAHFWQLLGRKSILLVNRTGLSDNYQMAYFRLRSRLLRYGSIGFWPLAVFGLSGLAWMILRRRGLEGHGPLILYFFVTSLVLILGHIIDRYREVLVPVLALWAADFLAATVNAARAQRGRELLARGALVLVMVRATSLHAPNFDQVPLADAHNQVGLLYHARGDLPRAIGEYREALRLRPNHLWAGRNLAEALLRSGEAAAAETVIKQTLLLHHDALELYLLLEAALRLQGMAPRDAREAFLKMGVEKKIAAFLNDAGASPAYAQGFSFLQQKRYSDAIASFEAVLKEHPQAVQAMINAAVCYRSAGNPQKAVRLYQRCLEIMPALLPARYNLAMTLMSQSLFSEALPHLEGIVCVVPEFSLSQYYLGVCYERLGRAQESIAVYRRVVERLGDSRQEALIKEQLKDKIWMIERSLAGAAVDPLREDAPAYE